MAEVCGEPVGLGAIQFRCRIEGKSHPGPCSTPEVGPSVVARERWLREQRQAASDAQSAAAEPVKNEPEAAVAVAEAAPTSTPQDASISFSTNEQKLAQARASLQSEELPPVIHSWMLGGAAQISLVELWRAWVASGSDELVLTKEHVENLVPPKLRL